MTNASCVNHGGSPTGKTDEELIAELAAIEVSLAAREGKSMTTDEAKARMWRDATITCCGGCGLWVEVV